MEDFNSVNFTQKSAKILVVDDQENARALLKRRLSTYGYEILAAASNKQALEILASSLVDVIFLNMFMNGASSYDFLVELKGNSLYRSIPIIMISSDSDVDLVVKCIEAGAEDYLVKPLNQTLLRARLSNCIAQKEAHDKEIAYLAKIERGEKQIVAQEKMASLGALVSSISQELKNPLNFIINFASVSAEICEELVEKIEQNKDSLPTDIFTLLSNNFGKFKSNVVKISEYGQNADKIIRFMLDQSKTSGGKKHPASINKTISQTITMLFSSYKNNGITNLPKIDSQFDDSIPHISISIQSFSKAIYNILDNAIYSVINKFQNVSEAKILIRTENLLSSIKILIYDNGNGIADGILDRIFIPFFTTKPEGTGPGLGLSTAREVIEDHSGNISVNSRENEFAEFTIVIPSGIALSS
ncbi:MAG: hybrid sensor histidine kinase/response regulator [Holosporaceae bacterium]|jgi:signal transduction histidine kinase|nr:hybrid sensor histidine kinase/response regulator [Holosporaceae bacterium]